MESFWNTITGYISGLEAGFMDLLPKIGLGALIAVIGFLIIKLLIKSVERLFKRVDFDRTIEIFLERTIRIFSWGVLVTIILGVLGVDVSGLVAGFGVAGFVVGFALKDTLSNLAAGVFILFFKPFKVGDWIEVSGITGKVSSLGIAASSIKTRDNTIVTIPNSKVWGGSIKNLTTKGKLRVTMPDNKPIIIPIMHKYNVKKPVKIIKDLVLKDERVLNKYDPEVFVSSIDRFCSYITVRPMVKTKDYWSVRHDIVPKIYETLNKKGIKFN